MKTNEKTILELHEIGNKEVKQKLEQEYPTLFQNKTILQSAIEYLTEQDEEVIRLRKLESLDGVESILAEQKLVVIIRARNEKFVFDWTNTQQFKYYPVFRMDDFRLDHVYVVPLCNSVVSAPLCYKSDEGLEDFINQPEILGYYKSYFQVP